MKKLILIFLVCVQPICLLAQKTITVVSNIKVNYDQSRGTFRWYRPVFAHEGSTLAADSADYNEGDNFFDAYGNVVITQPNGTLVYADKLHYTEATQQALLTGNVRLVDQNSTLTTQYLTYNLKTKIGNYHGGGQIINGTDTLNSTFGYYFENSKDAYFRKNVVVRTSDAKIYTDSMRYNSASKMTYFYGPTNIRGSNGNLYTENGDYNTETKYARFGKNNLYTEGSKFLRGDSLLYDGQTGNGRAIRNVVFVDTAQHIVMRGQLGRYTKADEKTVMTQNAYIVLATNKDSETADTLEVDSLGVDSLSRPQASPIDSIYMTADTLMSRVILLKDYTFVNLSMDRSGGSIDMEEPIDSDEQETPVMDSLQAATADTIPSDSTAKLKGIDTLNRPLQTVADSIPQAGQADSTLRAATQSVLSGHVDSLQSDTAKTRIVTAYHDVRIYKSDFQAIADSVYYGYPDSLIRCFGSPMIWSQGSQLNGDTVYIQLKNQQIDNMLLKSNAFIVNTELDSSRFNQVKGRKISGFFTNGKLETVYVDGNAESIYHSVEDNQFTGMGRTLSGRIKLLFKDNKMTHVFWIKRFESTYYPIDMAPEDESFLEGFVWKPELRPKSKEAIIATDNEPQNKPIEASEDKPEDEAESRVPERLDAKDPDQLPR